MFKIRFYNPYSPWLAVPALLLFGVFFMLPNMAGVFLAFTDWNSYDPLHPVFIGLTNFRDMFEASIFYIAVKNTIYFTVTTTVVKLALGFLLALALNKALRLKNVYRTIVFAPVIVNPLVVALIFSSIYSPSGLINDFLRSAGLDNWARDWLVTAGTALNAICAMEIWMGIGVHVVIFIAGLQSISKEYYEASTIDGAGRWRQLFNITIPLAFHSITINIILCIVRGAAVFGQVYGLTNGGPADATQVYGTFIYKQFSQNGLYGYSAAAGLVFSAAISLLCFLLLSVFRKLEVEH